MRTYICVLTLLLMLSASAGYCLEFGTTARYFGMGGAGIAASDDAGALDFNPANLASLETGEPADQYGYWGAQDGAWAWQGIGTFELSGDLDYMAINIAGLNELNNWGLGVSFKDFDLFDEQVWTLGAGFRLGEGPYSVGASLVRLDNSVSETLFNIGGLYTMDRPGMLPIRIGATISDITDEIGGPFFNVGAAIPLAEGRVKLAIDVLDITDEVDTLFNIGAEAALANGWIARVGSLDGDLSLGAGYKYGKWNLDAAWVDFDSPMSSSLIVSGGMSF